MRLNALRETLRSDLNAGTERGSLVRSAGFTAGLKLGATMLAFGASLLYARVLGPHDYGLYAYVIAWTAVLTIPVGLGLPQYLVREGAKSPQSLRWLLRWADTRVSMVGVAASILLASAVFLPFAAGARWLFVIAAPLPLLNNLTFVRAALLQARGWIVRSQWPMLILGPAMMLIMLLGLWAWQGTLYPIELVAAMTAAAFVQLLVNQFQLHRASAAVTGKQRAAVRLRSSLPFMLLSGLYLLNSRVDLIMLGTLKGAQDAGIYAVAARAAELVTFFLVAAAMAIAPRIARLHQEGDSVRLQRLLNGASRRILILSSPVALLLIVGARPLLTYLYGAGYGQGTVALQVLAGAQLINVTAGPTGTVLNMTGEEKLSALGVGLSVILNIVLNAALIPFYGIQGAATATGISLVAWNILLWYWIRRRLNLRTTGIGL